MKCSLLVLICLVNSLQAFIIPDEIPSLLSVIYSNIPVLKKGTDSRVGWGFRLGDRADFQTLLEIGPQTYTQPLANQGGSSNNKRNTLENMANQLYAQRFKEKQQPIIKTEEQPETKSSEWLQSWSQQMSGAKVQLVPKPGLGIGEIDAKSVIPEEKEVKKPEKALDDVSLD